jgi:hypothetical protein
MPISFSGPLHIPLLGMVPLFPAPPQYPSPYPHHCPSIPCHAMIGHTYCPPSVNDQVVKS